MRMDANEEGGMRWTDEDERSVRAYLLRELADEEQGQIEERLLSDRDYAELLLIIEDELVDSYVRGDLSENERKDLERFFLTAPGRRRKLKLAKALRRYANNAPDFATRGVQADPPKVPPQLWYHRAAWQVAASIVLMLTVGFVGWRLFIYESLVEKGRAALEDALRESPTEGRIADFQWPPHRATLGDRPENVVNDVALGLAESNLRRAVVEQPGPESHHALGQFYVATGEFSRAIEQFETALKDDPQNARLHNDLGAALLETAKTRREAQAVETLEDLNQALEHFNQALALNESLEALFNRALCHEQMQSASLAESDWREYLERDAISLWADEARRHLEAIERHH